MLSNIKLHGPASITMLIFGVLALGLGVVGIFQPTVLLDLLRFPVIPQAQRATGDFTLTFITASSMASTNMGIYYILAALTGWKAFYWWTVPFRCLTFVVFTVAVVTGLAPQGFIGVALWELVGALATGTALVIERRSAAKP